MVYVLLALKWIGIVLLVVLALVLLALLLVLFVPIRYKVDAQFADNKPELLSNISWFFNIVKVEISLENNKPVTVIKIFGIKIGRKNK